jgi:hypothetical protein
MRDAVVRIGSRSLSDKVKEQLSAIGVRFHGTREAGLEFLVSAADRDSARLLVESAFVRVLGSAPEIQEVTLVSRGTDADALGVVEAFGVRAALDRFEEAGEEVALLTLPAADERRVPESRLHTALEAALNCEVRIRYV